MKFITVICLSIIICFFSLLGCSKSYSDTKNIPNKVEAENKDKQEEKENEKENLTKIIVSYFDAMESHDIEGIKSLFSDKSPSFGKMDLSYIEEVSVKSIKDLSQDDESLEVYINYINEEYGIKKENIRLFEVEFGINSKEASQKIALIKEEESPKWLIAEMFR